MVPKIRAHMDAMPYTDTKGRIYKCGEFFPVELSPVAYNESMAQEYFPLNKEQALAEGYKWRDAGERSYQVTLKPEDVPDHILDVKDSITEEGVGCAHRGKCDQLCVTAFRITKDELGFYRKTGLPLPRLCHNCRTFERLKQRTGLQLYARTCECGGGTSRNEIYQNTSSHFHGETLCPNTFETTYSSNRKEIVYCEQCYQAEVA